MTDEMRNKLQQGIVVVYFMDPTVWYEKETNHRYKLLPRSFGISNNRQFDCLRKKFSTLTIKTHPSFKLLAIGEGNGSVALHAHDQRWCRSNNTWNNQIYYDTLQQ